MFNQSVMSMKDVRHGTASILHVSLPSERIIGQNKKIEE
jgi:hypothetical protein